MRKISIFGILFTVSTIAIFLISCSGGAITQSDSNVGNTADSSINGGSVTTSESAYKVVFQTEPGQVQAGTPATLVFTVKDSKDSVVRDLQIVHEKPLHLLIVSKDLAEFYHVHPELSPDGSYRVQHTFPNGGDYKLYADFTPPNAKQIVERIDVKVSGTERAKVALVADTKLEKSVDGLKVTMKPSAKIEAGQELTLDFAAFDAATGKPATDLQNYLGELAHFVIISEDLVDFVHAHPMAKGEKMDRMNMAGDMKEEDHNADGHSHGADSKEANRPSAYEVSAHTAFPRPGLYKLWAQFQRGGKVISVPFVVNVPTSSAKPVKAANVPAGATKITVSSSGYEPSSVSVVKGQPVKLAFYRADSENCGGEVVFAKQNIRKNLPVGETVVVEFTPTEAGEIAFACGMDMLSGKVVVTEN
ncbi:MAG: cupredoxin domain-containing protein [Acidobacteriota bacterium]|nr:MAG: cupredoxin domain-containing protein [Acidobacteriota bacterium]